MNGQLVFDKIDDVHQQHDYVSIHHLTAKKLHITDCSFVSKYKHLTFLNIGHNEIRQTVFLHQLTSLENLIICDNHISNLSFLQYLPNLVRLCVSGNQIAKDSLAQLSGAVSLRELTMYCPMCQRQNPIVLETNYRELIIFHSNKELRMLDRQLISDKQQLFATFCNQTPQERNLFLRSKLLLLNERYKRLATDIAVFQSKVKKIEFK